MSRYLAPVGWLAALLIAGGSELKAENSTSFKAAFGHAGSESFAFGIELWALTNIQLLPEYNIRVETVEATSQSDRLQFLHEGRIQFAVLDRELPASLAVDLRSVIAHRPNGHDTLGVIPLQLIARADVPEDVVYRITRMIFDHATKAYGNSASKGMIALSHAMAGLSLPVHPGAIRFFEDQTNSYGDMINPKSRDNEVTRHDDSLDKIRLNSDEVLQLENACGVAIALGEAEHLADHGSDGPCAMGKTGFGLIASARGGPTLIVADQEDGAN